MRDKCGVFGAVSDSKDVARDIYVGLLSLQHRGQESSGIAVIENGRMASWRRMGTIERVFSKKVLARLRGKIGIGHNRYATRGASESRNKQPLFGWFHGKRFALAHNGELVKYRHLRKRCRDLGYRFTTTTDSEVIVGLLQTSRETSFEKALASVLLELKGAFSLVLLFENSVYAVRDRFGIRPLVVGESTDARYVSSESCAFDVLGAKLVRDVAPGEIVVISEGESRSFMWANESRLLPCLFEYVYFSRPDSILEGVRVHSARKRMGVAAAEKTKQISLDVIVPVPDSGVSFALGYAEARGLPLDFGLFRAHSVARTFIEPIEEIRTSLPYLKFNPISEAVRGKRIGVLDDSVVRANTAPKIVKMLRDAGAKEIHMIVGAPIVSGTCHLGINMPNKEEIPGSFMSQEELRKYIGADSLTYLDLSELVLAVGFSSSQFCHGCMKGGTYAVSKE